jgi:hypothetical protein
MQATLNQSHTASKQNAGGAGRSTHTQHNMLITTELLPRVLFMAARSLARKITLSTAPNKRARGADYYDAALRSHALAFVYD